MIVSRVKRPLNKYVFSQLNFGGVYLKLGLVYLAFITVYVFH